MADAESARFIGGQQDRVRWRGGVSFALAGAWVIQGYSMFSVIEKASGRWVGRLGPWYPEGWPGPEVGWGLARAAWGKGYATEGAVAAIDWAFEHLGWTEVIHTIAPDNARSQALARRLGSTCRGAGQLPAPVATSRSRSGARLASNGGHARSRHDHHLRHAHLGQLLQAAVAAGPDRAAYRWVEIDSAHGQTRTPEYLARNPNGKVPLLELEDGRRLAESNAILCHLAEGTPWWPGGSDAHAAWQRAQTLQWLFFEQYSHEPYIAVARFICLFLPHDHPRRAELPHLHERGAQALAVMEQHLAAREWFVDDRYGVADIALYAYTHCAADGGFSLDGYPQIRAWLARVRAQPGHTPMHPPTR